MRPAIQLHCVTTTEQTMPETKPATVSRQSLRSAATRAKLVAVAERLFAERGIDGVSLSEINRASKQRNANACQYHFGNKEGLLQAIVDKHLPAIADRRNELLDERERVVAADVRSLIHAWVLPVVEKLEDPDGGSNFIRVNAQLMSIHTLAVLDPAAASLRPPPGVERLVTLMDETLAELPAVIRRQRLLMASVVLFHGLLDQARLLESVSKRDASHDTVLFMRNLEDVIVALLTAPVSSVSRERLDQL